MTARKIFWAVMMTMIVAGALWFWMSEPLLISRVGKQENPAGFEEPTEPPPPGFGPKTAPPSDY